MFLEFHVKCLTQLKGIFTFDFIYIKKIICRNDNITSLKNKLNRWLWIIYCDNTIL